jgi:hypothetical protein
MTDKLTGKQFFTGAVTAGAHVYQPGDEVPADPEKHGIDMERMKRLDLVSSKRERSGDPSE